MKLAVVIVVGVAVLGVAVASYVHYTWWAEHRFDQMIADAAHRHGLDPALVKALIRVQAGFPPEANEGRHGLMLVSERKIEAYRAAVLRRPWGYICLHRHFRNHDPNKPEQFTSNDPRRTCQAPGCGQPLPHEPLDFEINLDIGCWTLRTMQDLLQRADPGLSPNELERRMLVAYRYGLPEGAFTITTEQERFVTEVIRREIEYRPTFERLARRTRAGRAAERGAD